MGYCVIMWGRHNLIYFTMRTLCQIGKSACSFRVRLSEVAELCRNNRSFAFFGCAATYCAPFFIYWKNVRKEVLILKLKMI